MNHSIGKLKKHLGWIAITLLCLALPGPATASKFIPDIILGQGVTSELELSSYFPALKETNLDTRVFILDSMKPGATCLVLGGTHPNELAGTTAAILILENARMLEGRLIIVPFANSSAASVPDTRCNIAQKHILKKGKGTRHLYYGNRRTAPRDQPGGEKEERNLNRVYPGNSKGKPTQKLAHAIMTMIRKEQVDFCIDFHEARTLGQGNDKTKQSLAYCLIAHPRGLEIAAYSMLDFESETGVTLKLEESGPAHKGLSHWEIGDKTDCIPFLTETPNPGQDAWRTAPDVINDENFPLTHRVGIHIGIFVHLAQTYVDINKKPFRADGLMSYSDLMEKGIESFLNQAK